MPSPHPRPPFAKHFPSDPALDSLVDAFARGDYARVRKGTSRLIIEGGTDDVRVAAKELYSRTEIDPLAKALLALTAVLLMILAAYWSTHNGPSKLPQELRSPSGAAHP